MARNVFGDPITDSTVRKMPEYQFKKVISRKDRAAVALLMKNQNGKDEKVSNYVQKVAKDSGSQIATLCVIYNATGDTITCVDNHDWFGAGLAERSPYPITIANGQWGGFVHVKPAGKNAGSHGAVVYRGKNQTGSECGQAGDECDWMVYWGNPYHRDTYDNRVYTQIREKGFFQSNVWNNLDGLKKKHVMTDKWKGCVSSASTSSGNKAEMEAIFTLE